MVEIGLFFILQLAHSRIKSLYDLNIFFIYLPIIALILIRLPRMLCCIAFEGS